MGQLSPSSRVLMGPGPSDVHPRVLQAMSTPLLGHLDPEFVTLMNETQEMLRSVFLTEPADVANQCHGFSGHGSVRCQSH